MDIDKKLDQEELEKEMDKIAGSSVAEILVQYLKRKVDELNSIVGVETIKELHGRKNAVRKLQEIINRLEPKEEVSAPNEYK